MDYSEALIKILRTVPTLENMRECICDEAINMPVDVKYDAVLSSGVFHYFYDLKYADSVLTKLLQKANASIGILNIHDSEKEEKFLNFRRQLTPNYDEHYKGLPKLFYSKNFFKNFAEKNNLKITFTESYLDGFWDNPYIYNCFMYKA